MASQLYKRLQSASTRLLTRFDQEGTQAVVQVVLQPIDPLDPPQFLNEPVSVKAVVSGVSSEIVIATPDLALTDLKVITANDGVWVPEVGQHVLIDGKDRATIRVDKIPASGLTCAFRFYVR